MTSLVDRFTRALRAAKTDADAIPERRREELSRRFDEATEQARAHAGYRRR